MKSSKTQLKSRGYITDEDLNDYENLTEIEILELLNSQEAFKRTIAVRLLSEKNVLMANIINIFCDKLSSEKKLYTKIELCDALSKFGLKAAKVMVNYLGKIGNNQYKKLPENEFKKNNYPLPRDIIARTLAHMGKEVLPELTGILKTDNTSAVREAIDAIGFICFYDFTNSVLEDLIVCFEEKSNDDIIRWKLVRAFECFNNRIIIDLLTNIQETDGQEIIRREAKRSLRIIKSRIK